VATELTPQVVRGRQQVIQSYGGGAFTVAGERYRGAILVFPECTQAWPEVYADVTPQLLAAVTAPDAAIALVLLGLGAQGGVASLALRAALKEAGVAVEAMTTAAACRTFNVLLAEERRVAAALLAVDQERPPPYLRGGTRSLARAQRGMTRFLRRTASHFA
jgi:uncharacterized protein